MIDVPFTSITVGLITDDGTECAHAGYARQTSIVEWVDRNNWVNVMPMSFAPSAAPFVLNLIRVWPNTPLPEGPDYFDFPVELCRMFNAGDTPILAEKAMVWKRGRE